MIVDTSALFAVIAGEEERAAFIDAILSADAPKVSAASLLELAIVVDRQDDPILSRRVDDLVDRLGLDVVAVTSVHAQIGRAAYRGPLTPPCSWPSAATSDRPTGSGPTVPRPDRAPRVRARTPVRGGQAPPPPRPGEHHVGGLLRRPARQVLAPGAGPQC